METFLRGAREGLEHRLAAAENAAEQAVTELDRERRRIASRERAVANELEEVGVAHRAELREAKEAGHAAARAAVVEARALGAARVAEVAAASAPRQELAELVEAAAARKGEVGAPVPGFCLIYIFYWYLCCCCCYCWYC